MYKYHFYLNPKYYRFWSPHRLRFYIFNWACKRNKIIESYDEINHSLVKIKTVPNMSEPI